MTDQDKTPEQLVAEIDALRQRVAEFERLDGQRREAENALRESENRYRALAESTNDLIIVLDRQGAVLYANPAAAKCIDISCAQIVGKRQMDLFPPEMARSHLQKVQRVFTTGEPLTEEERFCFGPKEIWIRVHLLPLRDDDGQITSVMGVCHDITQSKHAEEELRKARDEMERRIQQRTAELSRVNETVGQSRDELQAIYDGMFDGLLIVDVETHRYVKANASICRMLGYSESELLSMTTCDIHPAEEVSIALERIRGRAEGQFHGHVETWMLRKDGSLLRADVVGSPLTYRGRPCVVAFFRDITEQRRAEDALRASEQRFRAVFEEAPVGMMIGEADGVIVRVNRALCRASGYSEEEFVGRHVRDFVHPEDLQLSIPLVKKLLSGEIPSFTLQKRFIHKDGHVLWSQSTTAAVSRPPDSPFISIGLVEDITERKSEHEALERERRTLRHMLRASDHERQLIAYDIHDGLAQELAGALMQFQVYALDRITRPDEAEKLFQTGLALLKKSHKEVRRLISGVRPPILDESGVVAAVAHLVFDPVYEAGPKIDLRNQVRFKRLAPILENVVYRIVQEGLSNARKHSKSDRILVGLFQRGDRLRVVIRDWGLGFDPAARHSNRFGIEGIRQRARLLGGTCSIRSKPGEGTRILVELPVLENEAEE